MTGARWALMTVAGLVTGAVALSARPGRVGGVAPASRTGGYQARQQQAPPAEPLAPPVLTADYDYTRLVRIWNIEPPAGGAKQPGYAEPVGARIIQCSNVPAASGLALLASTGFTLLQTDSDHLSTEETRPNIWDFSQPDAARGLALASAFDWCYFPHFAFPPPWYSQRIQYVRVRCLEHDQAVEAWSPWDPNFGYFISRGYERLARHYGAAPTPAFYLGVHGDYGECGLMIGARTSVPGQKEDWERRFGNLHNHVGWWCADTSAKASFRTAMLSKYGSLASLNAAWRTSFRSEDEIAYPSGVSAGSRRYWLDWVAWYQQGVSNLTDVVCRVARRSFPEALMMLPCGFGDEDPRTGVDNSMLAKIAARHRVDVRSTHGGFRPFPQNQATMLGRLASACRFYGAPFWTEPPSTISPDAQVGRIFEAITLGARGHFDWASNVQTGREAYYRYGKHMRISKRVVDVAMFYPTTSHLLRPGQGYPRTFEQGCSAIRDVLDYDIVDERMVLDGALERYRVLVWWEGAVVEASVLAQIRSWIERGGALVIYDCGKIETVEGDTSWFRDVLGYAGKLTPTGGTYRFVPIPGTRIEDAYRISVGNARAATFLDGDWEQPETTGGVERRWTGAEADVKIPVHGGTDLVLSIRASFPPEAVGRRREVLVNGTQVGILDLAGEHTYRFAVPGNLTAGRNVTRITLRCETFVPAAVLARSQDPRNLGVWVTYVQLAGEDATASTSEPGPPQGRFEVAIDYRRLRGEFARKLGSGWTIYFPARKEQLPAYYEAVRYAVYHLSDLDAKKQDAIVIDDAWDGVYASLCTDKAIYYNPGPNRALRTIVLSPSAFAGRADIGKPTSLTHELTLEPASISVIPFGRTPQELLLQCEKFTSLGELKPQDGAGFSPGEGDTHVLVPVNGQISTRFECPAQGRYRVFYRAWRRNALCPANVTVNGKPCGQVPGHLRARASQQTLCAGEVSLSKGVHSLVVRPLPGQDIRADFVVLAADPAVAGYGFAAK